MEKQKKSQTLYLKYIGLDDFSCPVYEDQHKNLWKDINLGHTEPPSLYSVTNNEIDGEPMSPIKGDYHFSSVPYQRDPYEQQYRILSRLKSDCDYFLGHGLRSPRVLWGKTPTSHFDYMKEVWKSLPRNGKPEWLTWNQILDYEQKINESYRD